MNDLLKYKTMITPGIIKILSYIGMVAAFIFGLITIAVEPLTGIGFTILGPVAVRIQTELILVMFEIHSELKTLNKKE
jgi:hypothetical protein